MFMLFVHRSASRFVSQLELVNGTTLRIKSSVIFGNAFREVPLQQASLSSAVYTGHGATGTDLPATQTPWYRRIFKSRSSRLYLIVERPRMRLSIDRLGVFPNPQFLDKLFAEKDTWLARTSAQKRA
nr:hypothetical protein HK105_006616 [Polyrhizophydium stewartii]